jgi:hypothetical protein
MSPSVLIPVEALHGSNPPVAGPAQADASSILMTADFRIVFKNRTCSPGKLVVTPFSVPNVRIADDTDTIRSATAIERVQTESTRL